MYFYVHMSKLLLKNWVGSNVSTRLVPTSPGPPVSLYLVPFIEPHGSNILLSFHWSNEYKESNKVTELKKGTLNMRKSMYTSLPGIPYLRTEPQSPGNNKLKKYIRPRRSKTLGHEPAWSQSCILKSLYVASKYKPRLTTTMMMMWRDDDCNKRWRVGWRPPDRPAAKGGDHPWRRLDIDTSWPAGVNTRRWHGWRHGNMPYTNMVVSNTYRKSLLGVSVRIGAWNTWKYTDKKEILVSCMLTPK